MSEVRREPIHLTIGEIEYEAFDESHSLADIARWIMRNPVDAEELREMLGEMLAREQQP